MKQPLIDLEPEVHPSEDQEVPEPTRMEEGKEKPPTPTVDQATPDSALSEEEQQDDRIAPPTPPPSHFETPVPEGEDIQVRAIHSPHNIASIILGRCCSEAHRTTP